MDLSSCILPAFSSHEIKAAKNGSFSRSGDTFCIQKATEVVFVYGKLTKKAFEQLLSWQLSSMKHFLYFIGSEAQDLRPIIENLDPKCDISRIKICLEKYLDETLMSHIGWKSVFLPFEVLALEKTPQFFILNEKLISVLHSIEGIASDTKDFNKQIYSNTLQNIQRFKSLRFLYQFQDALKGVPAIICGAGESLLLDAKDLNAARNRAVVFSGGTSLRILDELKISYDIAAVIDPDPLFERFKDTTAFEVPWICLLRNAPFFHQLFQGESIIALEEENLLEKDIFDELNMFHKGYEYGWNVGNFQAFIAAYLGCNPIVMTGMDMGFTQSEYAIEMEKEGKVHKNYEGLTGMEKFQSRKDLFLGKEYFESLAVGFLNTKFYQTSNSALCPKGFVKEDLTKLIASFDFIDINAKIHQMFQQRHSNEKINNFVSPYVSILQKDLSKAIKIFEEIKKIGEALQDKGITCKSFKEEYLALEEYELEGLKTFKVLIQPIWSVWKHLLYRGLKDEENSLGKAFQKYLFFQKVVEEFIPLLNGMSKSEPSDGKRSI